MKKHKDNYSTNVESSMSEELDQKHQEAPSESEMDMHHETLMKAQAIKSNKHLMEHLAPHMEKKMGHMKAIMMMPVDGKITSIEGLKKKQRELP